MRLRDTQYGVEVGCTGCSRILGELYFPPGHHRKPVNAWCFSCAGRHLSKAPLENAVNIRCQDEKHLRAQVPYHATQDGYEFADKAGIPDTDESFLLDGSIAQVEYKFMGASNTLAILRRSKNFQMNLIHGGSLGNGLVINNKTLLIGPEGYPIYVKEAELVDWEPDEDEGAELGRGFRPMKTPFLLGKHSPWGTIQVFSRTGLVHELEQAMNHNAIKRSADDFDAFGDSIRSKPIGSTILNDSRRA